MTRPASDVGAGLLPARDPRPIRRGERIHVVGAAGAGASGAALIAHHAGAEVDGCDPGGPSPYTPPLEAAGIPLDWQHSADHVQAAGDRAAPERLAVTKALTSVNPDHPELSAAREAGIALEAWQQVVADAAATTAGTLVAVAGTHGKSTTAGWLVDLLVTDGRDPAAFVGALLPAALTGGLPATARWGVGGTFVIEADEYAGNFDPFRPEVALLLNVEWDHPDVFADRQAVEEAFAQWLDRAAADEGHPTLVANIDDPGVVAVCRRLSGWYGELLAVTLRGAGREPEQLATGTGPATVLQAELASDEGRTRLLVRRWDGTSREFAVGLPGRHNAANALAVVGAAAALGVSDGALRSSLAGFGGVGRRLELKGEAGGVTVIDDYGHHPTAIARNIDALRQRYPGRRVWAVYEPLTFHRTAHMLEDFAGALAGADRVAIADIWAGRDPDTSVTSSAALASAVGARGGAPAIVSGTVEQTADHLAGAVEAGDVVLVMGGGRSYVIAERLLELLRGHGR